MGIRQKKKITQRDLWSGGELLEGRECLNAKSKLRLSARVDLAGDCGRKHPGAEERAHATGQSMGVTTDPRKEELGREEAKLCWDSRPSLSIFILSGFLFMAGRVEGMW